MPELKIAGATLHYQTLGQGPLLLCISGANGDCDVWRLLAQHVSKYFTVVSYDRRGFSRSYLSGTQDYSRRLETDADDAATLIKHLSPREPATVLGTSSGAIVALTLLARHPDILRLLISHEPPAFKLQPGTDALFAEQVAIYNIYRANGIHAAIERFANFTGATHRDEVAGLQAAFNPRAGPYRSSNAMYWFEREMREYPMADLHASMFHPHRSILMTVNAQLTPKDALQFRANECLAKDLGLELILLPGGHVGYATHAAQFAQELMAALREKDTFYAQL